MGLRREALAPDQGCRTSPAAACGFCPAHLPPGKRAPPCPSSQAGAQFPVVRWSHTAASGRTGVYCLSERGRNLHGTSMLGPCCASSPCRHWCSVLHRKAQSQNGQWPGMVVTCRWQLHVAPFREISDQCYHHPDVHSCADGYGERGKEQSSAGS